MGRLNLYESFVVDIIEKYSHLDKICIDIDYPQNKLFIAKKYGYFSHLGFVGDFYEFKQLIHKIKLDYIKTNKAKFLRERGYIIKHNHKFLVAIKYPELGLYNE